MKKTKFSFESLLVLGLFILYGCVQEPLHSGTTVVNRKGQALRCDCEQTCEADDGSALFRLPEHVVPAHYSLVFDIDPEKDFFSGQAAITIEVSKPTNRIWIHGNGLEVQQTLLHKMNRPDLRGTWTQQNAVGMSSVDFDEFICPGRYTLDITYRASQSRKFSGIYKINEESKSYVFTQFEAIEARRAFPCFDEPSFKAPLNLYLIIPKGLAAVANSNGKVMDSLTSYNSQINLSERNHPTSQERKRVIQFEVTPPLPTYLYAFAVGPFDIRHSEGIHSVYQRTKPIAFRGITVEGKGDGLDYAFENTPAILKSLEKYFGGTYPFSKLDIMAVPGFFAGAMENAELIVFNERLLLGLREFELNYVMAHELAHHWFGNSVTMKWWDDIWLNESFATWLGYKISNIVFPDKHYDKELLIHIHSAMYSEIENLNYLVRRKVENQEEILRSFNPIIYYKGAAILRMVENWIGEKKFQKGVQNYIRKYAFGKADVHDLIQSINDISDQNVSGVFNSFLFQPGYPEFFTKLDCDSEKPVLEIQRLDQSTKATGATEGQEVSKFAVEPIWQVPICVRYSVSGKMKTMCHLVQKAKEKIVFDEEKCPDWYFPNANAAGYFKFKMDQQDRRMLILNGKSKLNHLEQESFDNNIFF